MKKKAITIILIITFIIIGFGAYKIIENYRYPTKYSDYIYKYAAENDIPPSMIFAVIHTESGFDPTATSTVGARGLMQITEDTFLWVKMRNNDTESTFDDLYDPETNIKYGSWLLKLLLDEFNTTDNAICAYHAGWGTAIRWINAKEYAPDGENITNIPYPDTKHHVYKFNKAFEKYKRLSEH